MSPMSERNGEERRRGRRRPSYDAPGWDDEGALVEGKPWVRKATDRQTGREGVIKYLAQRARNPGRFHDEAVNMLRLNGTRGILPVWDIDRTEPDRPRWYAMPLAQLLRDALGDDATLRDVVGAVAVLAGTLADLAEDGVYHRDIKPDNLFWWDQGPVLADFGLAAWGTAARRQAAATQTTERLGPANFIAPEMRYNRPEDRGERADVYSLAKTLFVLALPHRGPYPPDGTHRVGGMEFFMGEAGGGSALSELGHVLEAATEFDPGRRLQMSDFRDELRAWLSRHSGERFTRLGDQANYERVAAFMAGDASRDRRDREETTAIMIAAIGNIAEALSGDKDAWAEEDNEGNGEVLGKYAWGLSDEDGPEGGSIWMATQTAGGHRIVLMAVLDVYVSFIAEAQTGGPPWKLEKQWDRTEWARPRMPRTAGYLKELTDQVIAWIITSAVDPGELNAP